MTSANGSGGDAGAGSTGGSSGASSGSTGGSSGASSGSTGGSSGTSSGAAGGSGAASGVNIGDLTNGLKQIEQSGPPDVKLSTETANEYIQAVTTFRDALQSAHDQANGLGPLNLPCSLGSAQQTASNFEADRTGINGMVPQTAAYIDYLNEFITTVKKASDRLIQSG